LQWNRALRTLPRRPVAAKTAIVRDFLGFDYTTAFSDVRQIRGKASRGTDRQAIREAKPTGEKRNLRQSRCR
jgi:hypothetical protein